MWGEGGEVNIQKKGPPRKSRKTRLPIANTSGETSKFEPSISMWAAIEKAYGRTLDSDARDRVVEIMNDFLFWVSNETNAPYLDDSLDWLDGFKDQMVGLLQTLPRSGTDSKQAAAHYAAGRIFQSFNSLQSKEGHLDMNSFTSLVSSMNAACDYAQNDFQRNAHLGFAEGTQWAAMVKKLTAFAKERKLPSGARKDSDKRTDSPPFVSLVMELMRFVPESMRRHAGSWQACAQAISQARRQKSKREPKSA